MTNLKKRSLLAIGGLAMVMNAGAASSSTTNASAIIDWSTFAITGYSLGPASAPTYTLSGQASNTSSSISDWVNWSSNVSNNGSSFGASTEGTGAGYGNASAIRAANLAISGSGFLVISANYILNAAINGIGCAEFYCYDQNSANASTSLSLTNYSSGASHLSSSQASISLGSSWWYDPASSLTYDHKEGTLSVGLIVNDGDILNFSSEVSAAANEVAADSANNGGGSIILNPGWDPVDFPIIWGSGNVMVNVPANFELTAVPVPAAIWLFGSALLGFVGLGRQKRVVAA